MFAAKDPKELSDPELFQEFSGSGNSDYYEEIVNRYKDKLYNFICRYTSDRSCADDILQDVLIKVYFNASKLKNFEHVSAWMFRIAVNTSVNYMRKKRLLPYFLFVSDDDRMGPPEPVDIPDPSLTPEGQLLATEREDMVQRAISHLPLKYRSVIVLQYISGLQLVEISEILNKPLGTIKSLSSRGRDLMKTHLDRYMEEDL